MHFKENKDEYVQVQCASTYKGCVFYDWGKMMLITYYDKDECRKPCLPDQLHESELCFPFTYTVVCSLDNGSCFFLSVSVMCFH